MRVFYNRNTDQALRQQYEYLFTFPEHLPYSRHCFKHSVCFNSLTLTTNLRGSYYYYYEEMKPESLSNSFKVL